MNRRSARRLLAAWLAVLTICTIVLGTGLSARWSAREEADRATAAYQRRASTLRALGELRLRLPPCLTEPSGLDAGDAATLSERVQARLLPAAGLEPATLRALAPLGRTALTSGGATDGPAIERDSITLAPVTLERLGAFLSAWRQAEPCRRIVGIELTPDAAAMTSRAGTDTAAGPHAGEPRSTPLRAVLTLESFIAAPAHSNPPLPPARPPSAGARR